MAAGNWNASTLVGRSSCRAGCSRCATSGVSHLHCCGTSMAQSRSRCQTVDGLCCSQPPYCCDAGGQLTEVSVESILSVRGAVVERPPSMVNPSMATGEVEVRATSVEVLNPAGKLGMPVCSKQVSSALTTGHLTIMLRAAQQRRDPATLPLLGPSKPRDAAQYTAQIRSNAHCITHAHHISRCVKQAGVGA